MYQKQTYSPLIGMECALKVLCLSVLWCGIVASKICSESCVTTFEQGGPLPVQTRGEPLPFLCIGWDNVGHGCKNIRVLRYLN